MRKTIFVISGPSGCGKTTVLENLFQKPEIKDSFSRVLTVTSRFPRKGEKDGVDYRFVGRQEFRQMKRKGYFFETKKYLDDYYGTPGDFLDWAEKKNKNPVLCIDVEGGFKIKDFYKEKAVLIFIHPPSENHLNQRLAQRKSEEDKSLKKRLRIAKKEVKYATKYDYQIVNEDIERTTNQIKKIMLEEIKD